MRHVPSQQPQQHVASFLPKSVPPPSFNQSNDPLIPISTPETPHGENMGDQAFAPQGVYGPIGSNMPSNPSSQVFSSLGNSPLSSPQLPHHHRSDIWVYPFSTNSSNSAFAAPTPIGVLPSGYQAPPPLPQPIGIGGAKPNPFQRAVGGQMHKGGGGSGGHHHGHHGTRSLEQRGHSLEEDFLYGSNNPNPVLSSAPYHHKRWSVPVVCTPLNMPWGDSFQILRTPPKYRLGGHVLVQEWPLALEILADHCLISTRNHTHQLEEEERVVPSR